MTKDKKPEPTLDWMWNQCHRHAKKVFETPRSTFMKCTKGHGKNGVLEYPVFMIRKEAHPQ